MLFKRYLFLAACILFYIFGFIAYFTVSRAQIESKFREERVKYNVQGVSLIGTNAAPEAPTPPVAAAPIPAPAPSATPDSSTPTPAAPTSTDSSTVASPAASTAPDASNPAMPTNAIPIDSSSPALNPAATDPNVMIGPVPPPPSSPAPDSSTNAPPTPDSNSAPSAPIAPPSTMNDSKRSIAPFLVRAAYHPFAAPLIQAPGLEPVHPVLPSPVSTTAPVTDAPSATNNAPSASTNAAPPSAPSAATNNVTGTAPTTNTVPLSPTEPVSGTRPAAVEPSVIVFLYHQFVPAGVHISPKLQWTMNQDVFESEMKYIHDNGYHVVPMSDLIKFLNHQIGLPPNSVVITIDDGYKSAIVYAEPILKKYGYPWTFFIYPDFITVNESKGAASWNDLLALQAEGVDIESHSMTHPQLPKHTQKWKGSTHLLSPEEYDEWLTNELLGSKTLLEQKMGKPILALAYPYGAYNKEVEAKAIAAGYQYIFTVADNPVHSTTNPHSIGRYTMTQGVEKNFFAYLRQGALGLAEADPAPGATISNPRPVITAVLGYAGNLDPNSIETEVRDFGLVKHDFDPKTSTIRLYLPRDLVQPVNLVNIRVKDAQSGKIMVANWHFNYEPAGGSAVAHPPIAADTNSAPVVPKEPVAAKATETPLTANTNVAPTLVAPAPAPAPIVPQIKTTTSASATSSKGGH